MRYEDRSRTHTDDPNGENGTNGVDDYRDSAAIARDIQRTREEMDRTLTALEQKLTPSELISELVGMLRSHGGDSSVATDIVAALGRVVRENPLPAALIGVGALGMLRGSGAAAGDVERAAAKGRSVAADVATKGRSVASDVKQALRETGATTSDKARHAAGAVKTKLSDAAASAQETASRAADGASRAADRTKQSLTAAYEAFGGRIEENPLVMGGLGIALGAALGAAIPRSRIEDEMFGARSDEITDKARREGKALAEEAKRIALETKRAAERQAAAEGLDADNIRAAARSAAGAAQRVAREAGSAAKASAKASSSEDDAPRPASPRGGFADEPKV